MPYADPVKLKEYKREWAKKWRQTYPSLFREQKRQKYQKNLEANRVKSLARYYVRKTKVAALARQAENNRHSRRHRLYGLTKEEFASRVAAQDGLCSLCARKPKGTLVIDHCHETGKIRGLLCPQCNTALGRLGDTIEGLERALRYLRGD